MAQRQNIVTYDSAEVQGEGSWVKVRQITHGESKRMLREYGAFMGKGVQDVPPEKIEEMQAQNDALIARNVIEWNWVDEDGDPLPLPQKSPEVLDDLTESETKFIGLALRGDAERKK